MESGGPDKDIPVLNDHKTIPKNLYQPSSEIDSDEND
jgi:hypothetical protein